MAMSMKSLAIPPGEDIPESALPYFSKMSEFFHGGIHFPGPNEITNIGSVIRAWNSAQQAYYPTYQLARDWAEESMAPFPIPVERYVFGLVQRWPYPAQIDQAKADYKVLLRTFGQARVSEVAKKVQSAMGKNGVIHNPDALGVPPEYARNSEFYTHNPNEVLWTLLTNGDPKLSKLHTVYRARYVASSSLDEELTIRAKISLQSIVDDWQHLPVSTPTPNATPTPSLWTEEDVKRVFGKPTPEPSPSPEPTPTPTPVSTGPNTPMVANPQSASGQMRLTDDGSAPPLLQVDDKEDPTHDPEFRFWSNFKPGTLITFITTHSVMTKDGQKITDKLSTRDSFRIESSDKEWIEISCSEATLNEGQWYGPPPKIQHGSRA
jgi:hypothetical protein